MPLPVIIVGGGIGGLGSALALARIGRVSHVFEQTAVFQEIGAGLQLGPNAVRRLQALGLGEALSTLACAPEKLQIRNAITGADIGRLNLGHQTVSRYGAPYLTLHRADLHAVLLQASREHGVSLSLGHTFSHTQAGSSGVDVYFKDGSAHNAACLIGADGLRSAVRQTLLQDGPPHATGHIVFRGLIKQTDLPQTLRCQHIMAWLGPALHVVQYPVKGGEWLNVVVIVHQQELKTQGLDGWDCEVSPQVVLTALSAMCAPLADLIAALKGWRAWTGFERKPVVHASQLAQGLTALLGDAAHPMRPYLAQGAGMAIEDAHALSQALCANPKHDAVALQHYAQSRWARVAKVQVRAQRNGYIFHAKGVIAYARDTAIAMLGDKVLDVPWLYAG
jgi:salicylate hydroxylase